MIQEIIGSGPVFGNVPARPPPGSTVHVFLSLACLTLVGDIPFSAFCTYGTRSLLPFRGKHRRKHGLVLPCISAKKEREFRKCSRLRFTDGPVSSTPQNGIHILCILKGWPATALFGQADCQASSARNIRQ